MVRGMAATRGWGIILALGVILGGAALAVGVSGLWSQGLLAGQASLMALGLRGGAAPPGDYSRRLVLVEGGVLTPLRNGATVPLGKGVAAEVFVAPFPPALGTNLDLYLFREASGEPISGAQGEVVYEMVYMDHGISKQRAESPGPGHYLIALDFLMYGDWTVDIAVQLPEGKRYLTLIMGVYP